MKHSEPLFMPMRKLMELLGVKSRQTIYTRMRTDPEFPRRCGGAGARLMWRTKDVLAYVEKLPEHRLPEHDGSDLI